MRRDDRLAAEDHPDRLADLDRTGEIAVLGLVAGVAVGGVAIDELVEAASERF